MPKGKIILPYLFSDNITLTANSSSQLTFQIDATYDFMATGWSYRADGLFDLQFLSNEQKIFFNFAPAVVFNGVITGVLITGDKHFNTFKPKGYLFKARSNINVALIDTSAAPNTIDILIDGFRVYHR